MSRFASSAFVSFAALSLVAACAKPSMFSPDLPGPAEAATPAAEETGGAPAAPDGSLERADVDAVLREGPAWLLTRIQLEETLDGGKFRGWRLRELPQEWSRVDLRAGDVVTRVNAMPLETPSDFWSAWTTLSVASEVKIDFTRDGAAKELRVPIVGKADPAAAAKLGQAAPTQRPPRDKRYDTITIRGSETAYGPR
ncbi:MAG: serine protease [Myxococcales bacterium]|nr:serine protease [Myxococcales bacterium]